MLPPAEYPIQDLPLDHPIFKSQFQVKEFPQIPSIQSWRGNPYETSERGDDSADAARPRPSSIAHGNVMVLMTHNTDISDAWEREGEDPRYFYQFSPEGYAVGINVDAVRDDALGSDSASAMVRAVRLVRRCVAALAAAAAGRPLLVVGAGPARRRRRSARR